MEKVTYASLASLGQDFHSSFDRAASKLCGEKPQTHPLYINGKAKKSKLGVFEDRFPADTRKVMGLFQKADMSDVKKAVAAAQAAFPLWSATSWQERIVILRRAADLLTARQVELAALLAAEAGKNRFEAIAEVSETIDLIVYYCRQMEEHNGYLLPLESSDREKTRSILKPYGVWAVIAPFNFPMALAGGMAAGALVAGNTVIFKPASDTPFSGLRIYEAMQEAGLPDGVMNFITGEGRIVGRELLENPDINGLIFTGSRDIGMSLSRKFSTRYPKPCITEMGGKNPAIIMPSADIEAAVEGVYRSAFGMGGQKCSACSRIYLHRDIAKSFIEQLVEKTKTCRIGNPLVRDTFLGPLINKQAVETYQKAIRIAKKQGRILWGGNLLEAASFGFGHFVEPTLVDRLPKSSPMFQDEYFAPILAIAEVKSLDEALTLANQSDYGLTAGIFTRDEAEQKLFFDKIISGVTYVNRRGGATTGAWPGVQSFGGWKASGSSGKSALGPYYVAQFMREQSQTICS